MHTSSIMIMHFLIHAKHSLSPQIAPHRFAFQVVAKPKKSVPSDSGKRKLHSLRPGGNPRNLNAVAQLGQT